MIRTIQKHEKRGIFEANVKLMGPKRRRDGAFLLSDFKHSNCSLILVGMGRHSP